MSARSLVVSLGLALALVGASRSQEGDKPDPARPKFSREQGKPEELKQRIVDLLGALGDAGGAEKAKQLLAAMAPDEKAVEDALTPEGKQAIGQRLLEAAKPLFEGEPKAVAERMKLDPALSDVQVFSATTEDLLGMEPETDAATHFAGGLKRAARHLKPRVKFYAVLMRRPEAPETEGGVRLQLFVHFQGRYVLLGKVWRLED